MLHVKNELTFEVRRHWNDFHLFSLTHAHFRFIFTWKIVWKLDFSLFTRATYKIPQRLNWITLRKFFLERIKIEQFWRGEKKSASLHDLKLLLLTFMVATRLKLRWANWEKNAQVFFLILFYLFLKDSKHKNIKSFVV